MYLEVWLLGNSRPGQDDDINHQGTKGLDFEEVVYLWFESISIRTVGYVLAKSSLGPIFV